MKNILFVSHLSITDAANIQFFETAKYFRYKYDINSRFLFFYKYQNKDECCSELLESEDFEYNFVDIGCECQFSPRKLNEYIGNYIIDNKIDIIQTGWMFRYVPSLIPINFKSYSYYCRKNQYITFNKNIDNIEIAKRMNGFILSNDLIEEFESSIKDKFENSIVIPNSLSSEKFINEEYTNEELVNHMEVYYKLYFA